MEVSHILLSLTATHTNHFEGSAPNEVCTDIYYSMQQHWCSSSTAECEHLTIKDVLLLFNNSGSID